jgi:hypothetical protein
LGRYDPAPTALFFELVTRPPTTKIGSHAHTEDVSWYKTDYDTLEFLRGEIVKRPIAFMLSTIFALTLCGVPIAHASPRASLTKSEKDAQKAWKKYNKQYLKKQKKALKAQKKWLKQWNKEHRTVTTVI